MSEPRVDRALIERVRRHSSAMLPASLYAVDLATLCALAEDVVAGREALDHAARLLDPPYPLDETDGPEVWAYWAPATALRKILAHVTPEEGGET